MDRVIVTGTLGGVMGSRQALKCLQYLLLLSIIALTTVTGVVHYTSGETLLILTPTEYVLQIKLRLYRLSIYTCKVAGRPVLRQ